MSKPNYWTPDHNKLLHTLIERGEIDPDQIQKRNLQTIFNSHPIFADFAEGPKYIAFRKHLKDVICDRILNDTKSGKRRKG